MSTTVVGLIHTATDEVTAAIGWVEMNNRAKAISMMKQAVGRLIETEARLVQLLKDMEDDLERHDEQSAVQKLERLCGPDDVNN